MTKRVLQVNQVIQRELSQIILREVEFHSGTLVTVTRVETSPNLKEAKFYISSIPDDQTPKILEILNKLIYQLQQGLNKRLNMKPVPRIRFIKEAKTKEAARIEELLEQIKKKG